MTVIMTILLAVGLVCLLLSLYVQCGKRRKPAPLPPGPKSRPLLGNVTELLRSQQWVMFSKWGEIYGGIVHVSALGQSIVVLNDAKYALDTLDKKGRLYSNRPTLMMAGKLVGWDEGPALIQISKTWGEYRRLFAQFMGTRAKIDVFQDVLQQETHTFLRRTLVDPEGWVKHGCKFAGSIVLTLAYGYKAVGDEDDRMVRLVDEAVEPFSKTTASNAFLVDVFSILRHVPEWFPGASWKKKVPKYRKTLQDMLNLPYDWVKQQAATGAARACFVSSLLEKEKLTAEEEHVIKWAAAGIYSGGADTTVAGIKSPFPAVTLHVVEQRKLKKNSTTLSEPTSYLPLLTACDCPILRRCSLNTSCIRHGAHRCLLHVLREDDVHNGYFIPKGSIVIANVWQFFKDPKTYAAPEAFSPERFIASEGHAKEKDPREYLFGFGRRRVLITSCPRSDAGLFTRLSWNPLADASMWLLCASALAAFDIRPPMKDGKLVLPSGKYMDGSISHPEQFECVITPRTRAAEALVHAAG
ncbi:cytochrome P450 monooxygenase 110 [Heterobasidion irregulare TC 32-1]|uniref:Cytochrome P450 monooxygenase 110 n=1 Tax=Heterobasidion irregulare (strain TC 32-1) TaxID=747525 RepID=W4K104_HETIT|nr:cytochrome P450 monooxygenase 110 [Heterobasidion irregulare TC 32-1]ETW79487.1 cytochrome P450 monooxygenase 110 [Heterobasidion irregulare TC 32-1]